MSDKMKAMTLLLDPELEKDLKEAFNNTNRTDYKSFNDFMRQLMRKGLQLLNTSRSGVDKTPEH